MLGDRAKALPLGVKGRFSVSFLLMLQVFATCFTSPSHGHEDHQLAGQRVLTIFFRGTNSTAQDGEDFNRFFAGELISVLARNHPGQYLVDYIDIDGPASGNSQVDQRFKFFERKYKYSFLRGALWGSGLSENIEHALAVLKGENHNPHNKSLCDRLKDSLAAPLSHVNLVGFSRGAISAIVLANKMHQDAELKSIKVNIFAIEPVAGPFGQSPNTAQLPENVADFVGIYATDEHSSGFEANIPTPLAASTQISLYNFPGHHLTLVGNKSISHRRDILRSLKYSIADLPNESKLQASSLLIRDLAEKFLLKHQTKLKNRLKLKQEDILTLYAQIQEHRACYTACGKDSFVLFKNNLFKKSRQVFTFQTRHKKLNELHEVIDFNYLEQNEFVNRHHYEIYFDLLEEKADSSREAADDAVNACLTTP